MKCWGSFGTGYCCGCIGVFWLSIKANVYVQYQKETRTSKIWISTTPRHQASVGKKISTSNQNLKNSFFSRRIWDFRYTAVHCSDLKNHPVVCNRICTALVFVFFVFVFVGWCFLGFVGRPSPPHWETADLRSQQFEHTTCSRDPWRQITENLRSSKLEFSEVKQFGSRPFGNIQYRINLVIAIQTSILKNLSMRVFSQSHLKSIWEKTEYLQFKFCISYFLHFDQIPIPACSHICPAKMSLWNWYDGQRAKILPRHQNGYMI